MDEQDAPRQRAAAPDPGQPLRLPVGRYRARFEAERPVRMSEFPGSAWRGALGHALKRTVCMTRLPRCRECALYHSCAFPYFYDTPPLPGSIKMRRYQTAPHPYVLLPGEDGATDYALDFTLIGQANRHLALIIHALAKAAQGRKGVAGNILQLRAVEQETAPLGSNTWQPIYRPGTSLEALPLARPEIPPAPTSCRIRLLTPMRVKREGRRVGPVEFRFADLFGHLLRRVSMLTAFHTDTPLETDFRGLMAQARQVTARSELAWEEKPRYSNSQKAAMKLGGVVGSIHLVGVDLAPFWPYLWLGQFIHAGSGATMGLGRYEIEAASLQAHPLSPS
ncbi:MAG: CRISPR system precrRNA processing endoribonuclease RAMP protein Cas6 [Thiobacillaceae bacterium]|nr:CRISPR system precrRNA processing endoribonuclease RAMP protein Cas6 [Thiobacillaceae bacterium]